MARPTPAINPAFNRRGGLHRTRGFTLAECLIASVVLAVTVLGITGALTAATHQAEAMEVDAYSLSLARQAMEEIASRGFDPPASNDQPGWGAGSTVSANYDDIKDFNGLDEQAAAAASPVRLIDTISFRRQVSVEFRATPSGVANPTGDFALITVTVTPASHGAPLTLHRMAARYTTVRE
jgi:prepilin-type N-terminal cleavage/methylation domain-containing protein